MYIGIGIGLLCAVFFAIVTINIKQLSNQKVHFCTTTIFTSHFGVPICALIVLVLRLTHSDIMNPVTHLEASSTPIGLQIVYMGLGAFGLTLCHVIVAIALIYGDASKISILLSSDVLFAFLFQIAILGIIPKVLDIVGALLIVIGTLLIMFFKIIDKKTSDRVRNSCIGKIIFYKF
jgi:drug/metabolite transporter (DMT)-like permease